MSKFVGRSGVAGIDETAHRELDQLVHDITENSFDEILKGVCGKIESYTTWTSPAKTLKIREQLISRDPLLRVSSVVTKQYDGLGIVVETLTETLARDSNGRVISITRTFIT